MARPPRGSGSTYGQALGWSVGRFSWLNDPASKVNRYWRVIEEGSDATAWPWKNKRIVGLWGNDPRQRIGNDLTPFVGGRNNQKFVPFFPEIGDSDSLHAARAALYVFFEGGEGRNMDLIKAVQPPRKRPGGNGRPWDPDKARKRFYFWLMTRARVEQMPFVQGVIVRDVQAEHYYAKALASFDPMERELAQMREVFSHLLTSGGKTFDPSSRSGRRQLRELQAFDSYSRFGSVAPKRGRLSTEKATHSGQVRGEYLVTVNASASVQDMIRNSRGQLTRFQAEVAEINRRVARDFQNHLVELMERGGKRPASGQLIEATRDDRNRTPR